MDGRKVPLNLLVLSLLIYTSIIKMLVNMKKVVPLVLERNKTLIFNVSAFILGVLRLFEFFFENV